jgi:hypothetical protein
MPADPKPRKAKRVDKEVMSERMSPPPGSGGGGPRGEKPGTRKEDWIGRQLRKVYDEALHEEVPPDMLRLLDQLDEGKPR